MAKTIKKAVKKAAPKKAAKKVAPKKVVKKAVKKTVKKTVIKTVLLPAQKMFALEVALLDKLQSELFEAIAQKPQAMDFDEIRLFVDNVYMTLNKCVTISKDVKNALLKKDYKDMFTDTYNSPA
jgi:hypothetical protein